MWTFKSEVVGFWSESPNISNQSLLKFGKIRSSLQAPSLEIPTIPIISRELLAYLTYLNHLEFPCWES